MKKITARVLFISLSLMFISCSPSQNGSDHPSAEDKKQQAIEHEINKIRTELVSYYNPIIFPPKDFSSKKVYTYSLQKLLISEKATPVLFEGNLDDITKEHDTFVIHLKSRLSGEFIDDRQMVFHLKANYEDIKFLIENPPKHDYMTDLLYSWGMQKDFFVVCSISEVIKIVNYSVRGSSSEGSEDVELEIESPDTFSAHGKLIKLIQHPVATEK